MTLAELLKAIGDGKTNYEHKRVITDFLFGFALAVCTCKIKGTETLNPVTHLPSCLYRAAAKHSGLVD